MKIRTEYVATNSKDVVRHIMSGKWHTQYRRNRRLLQISLLVNLILFVMWVVK